MRLLIVFAFAASLWGSDIHVRLSTDSEQAAAALLLQLNRQGSAHDLRFVRTESEGADFTLVVSWVRGPGIRDPEAQVQVFAKDKTPLYTVLKRGVLTRRSAMSRCATALVEGFSKRIHSPKQ